MDGGDRFFPAANNHNDNTIMNRIMLRFRPIAPKPAVNGSVSGYSDPDNKKGMVNSKRGKRKYARRVKKNVKSISRSQKHNKAKEGEDWFGETMVTLELFPQIGKSSSENGIPREIDYPVVQQMNFNENIFHVSDLAVVPGFRVVESWVTMECVTDIFEEEGRLGCADTEKVNNLEADTCPGFVSDGVDGVRWVNMAYRRLVDPQGGGGEPPEVVVWLAAKEKFPVGRGAFSCRVRVVYGGGSGKVAVVLPCDVLWRMEFGGFAWRLDVQAALSLGR